MEITREQVSRIADLARLELEDEKIEKFASQFNEIIGYMDKMNAISTEGVVPMYSPSENTSVLRDDVVKKEYNREELLSNAPRHDGKYFIVPKIL
ncbi:MAG: Asp-tRNA(Asn)/Glu-tRNA(Gln) amidotransferase subunit GatC [Desulfonatronovibrio sp.]|nr:Asp-tRNA(Asn)/Glu-tRNA(Gln) amidotransferase subunit GatC [Desulfovibrionales bacterium]